MMSLVEGQIVLHHSFERNLILRNNWEDCAIMGFCEEDHRFSKVPCRIFCLFWGRQSSERNSREDHYF